MLFLHGHGTFVADHLILAEVAVHAVHVRRVITELTNLLAIALHAVAEAFILFVFLVLPIFGFWGTLLAPKLDAAPNKGVQ